MWKRCVLLLLGASCGSAGEIDLVLENKTSSALVVATANECGATHVQIFDADGRSISWRCGESARPSSSSDRIAEPVMCTNSVTRIAAGDELAVRWNGFYLEGDDCGASSAGPFTAQFCFGTQARAQLNMFGQTEEIVTDLRCESVSFELGVDLEARYAVQ